MSLHRRRGMPGQVLLFLLLVCLSLALLPVQANADTDGDGIPDALDPYPNDPQNRPLDRESTRWRVAEIYVATLGRAADAEGLAYWVNNIVTQAQWVPLTVAQSFFDQPEVQALYPSGAGIDAFVAALYQNVLGRAPDASGRDYWIGQLESGQLRRNDMIIALIEGMWANDEAFRNGDVSRFRNRTRAALAFADRQAEQGIYTDALDEVQRQRLLQLAADVLEGVTADAASFDSAVDGLGFAALLGDDGGDNNADGGGSDSGDAGPATPIEGDQAVATAFDPAFWRSVEASLDDPSLRSNDYLYLDVPNVENCDPGRLNAAAKQQFLEVFNGIRALHSLPPVTYSEAFDAEAQASSLIQYANQYLSHFPASSATCYSELGAGGARTSNLVSGFSGAGQSNRAITAHLVDWLDDRFDLSDPSDPGHRRLALAPWLAATTYGQVYGFASQKIFGFAEAAPPVDPALEFVAYPYRNYPYFLARQAESFAGARPLYWSFFLQDPHSLPQDYDTSAAQVSVTPRSGGEALPLRDLTRLDTGVTWIVEDYAYDVDYIVEVQGIRRPNGSLASYRYPVTLVYSDIFNINAPLEAGDSRSGSLASGRLDDAEDRDGYPVMLSGDVTIGRSTARFGGNGGLFIQVYDSAKTLLAESAEPVTLRGTAGQYTVVATLCSSRRTCYRDAVDYTLTLSAN